MDSEAHGIPWPKPREPRDYGIAVSDAKRLNDCWHELAEAFHARPALEGDEAHWFQHAGASPGNEEWVHQVNSRNVAEIMLRGAIQDRAFPIWLRLADGEVRADPNAITSISHKTLSTGLYLTENYPKANLEGRPLWIKNADWRRFYACVMASRYGEQVAPPAGSEPDDPLALWLALELRRARTAFDKARKEQDADFEAKGLRKSGVRVNNGAGTSPASNLASPPNELLETEHGKRLDPGTAGAAIGGDPGLEAVGAIDGTAVSGGEGTGKPQRRQGRKAAGAQG